MADIEKVRAHLRDMQRNVISVEPWDDKYKYDVYHQLAMTLTLLTNMEEDIKRLTPKPLTLDEAIRVLYESNRILGTVGLTTFQMVAVAEKIKREREAQ